MCTTKLMLIIAITSGVLVVFIIMLVTLLLMNKSGESTIVKKPKSPNKTQTETHLVLMSREDWKARVALRFIPLTSPIPYVIILQTNTSNCTTQKSCIQEVVKIQNYHMDTDRKVDILFNFIIGGEGTAFEGRGWKIQGYHTHNYNNVSISICFIGTFNDVPSKKQVVAAQLLIKKGIDLTHLSPDYILLGDRQLTENSNNPGDAFFSELKKWPHWSEEP